ncbi:hypothetical protein [Ornithinibacillus scapharcae]|uniref:hypothetical protein n=1 Tax=Ornithinibacillus scapharcae TaxID=1147159 RepID=UPI000225ADC9|nr:hypothetical protein [Ornithinibacillus scapharcae]
MRKLLLILGFIYTFMAGCSAQTLQEAIDNSDYGEFDKPEILYQNEDHGVVIFLTKDDSGEFIVCRSSFEKNKFNRYELDTNGDFSLNVDIGKKSEFIQVDQIEPDSGDSLHLVWGVVFNHPGAKRIDYRILNKQGEQLLQKHVNINKQHIFVDVVTEQLTDYHSVSFDVLDHEGNIITSYN